MQKEMVEEKELFGDLYTYNVKVEELQKMLKVLECNPGPVDGRMGYKTREAVKEFQKKYALKATGYVGKKTWEELLKNYKSEIVDFGEIDIKKIQGALKNAGFNPGEIDGKMGSKTKKAIQEFQKSKGLVPDGVVGVKTWSELKEWYRDR